MISVKRRTAVLTNLSLSNLPFSLLHVSTTFCRDLFKGTTHDPRAWKRSRDQRPHAHENAAGVLFRERDLAEYSNHGFRSTRVLLASDRTAVNRLLPIVSIRHSDVHFRHHFRLVNDANGRFCCQFETLFILSWPDSRFVIHTFTAT